jgi:hypothetical protein
MPNPPTPQTLGEIAAAVVRAGQVAEAADRRAKALGGIPKQLDGLALTVAGLANQVAELVAEAEDEKRRRASWFDVTDRDVATRQLEGLADWLAQVYLRYPDAKLPPCWAWHPDVVEELSWLARAWFQAFRGKTAEPFRQADWHDRYRPGVAKRIGDSHGRCSVRQHVAPDGEEYLRRTPRVALAERRPDIAAWWTTDRLGLPPSATEDDIREAEAQ